MVGSQHCGSSFVSWSSENQVAISTSHVPHPHDYRDVSLVREVTYIYALGHIDLALFLR